MAGMGPPPKPDSQRVRRNATTFVWTLLPAEHDVVAPPLPKWRSWAPSTLEWWENLWRCPQASQWGPHGLGLILYACLRDDLMTGAQPAHRVCPEMRAYEDRYGLSPKSLMQLRWLVPVEEPTPRPAKPKLTALERRLRSLK